MFTMFVALFGMCVMGVLLGMLGEDLLDAHREKTESRFKDARKKVMEQFSEIDTAEAKVKRTFFRDISDILMAEFPIVLILCLLGSPIIYLEGWNPVMG